MTYDRELGYGYQVNDPVKREEYAAQRADRGWDDTELWNLDDTLASLIAPRLRAFRDQLTGYPSEVGSIENWRAILDAMIYSFDTVSRNVYGSRWGDQKGLQEGLDLFARYFRHLWN